MKCKKFKAFSNYSNNQLNIAKEHIYRKGQAALADVEIKCLICTGTQVFELRCFYCDKTKGRSNIIHTSADKTANRLWTSAL